MGLPVTGGGGVTAKQAQEVAGMRATFGHCLVKEVRGKDLSKPDVLVVYDYAAWGENKPDHRHDPQVTTISPNGALRSAKISYKSPSYREWRKSLAETE